MTESADGPPGSGADEADGFPWYVKLMLAIAVLVVLLIVVIDLLEFATAL